MTTEVKAKYDYNSGHEDDLSFASGQILTVIEEIDGEWYFGEYVDGNGRRHQGMFPRNFVIPSASYSAVVPLASTTKLGSVTETPIKPKVSESTRSPNASAASTKSVTSTVPLSTNVKSDGEASTQVLHQPVCCPYLGLNS